MSASELKVKRFFLFFLKVRLLIRARRDESEFPIFFLTTKLDENFNELRYFVLVEEKCHFFGANRDVELDGKCLRVVRVMG